MTPWAIQFGEHAINAEAGRDYLGISGSGSVLFSAGTLSSVRSDITFSNANGVTFGLNNAGVITASVGPGGGGLTNIKVSAGVASELRSDITFSNSNGVSFGLNAGVITATVATNYQSQGAYLTTAQPPGAYLTTAMLSDASSVFAGTGFTTATTAGTDIVGTLNTSGLSLGIPAYLTTATAGAFTPRLDQVLDANTDKLFTFGSNQLQLQWATGGSFSTNATKQGMFEIDVQGNLTQEADVVHAHQHGGAPTKLDILHVEGDGANVTGLRLQMSASVAAEVNQPIKFTTEDAGYAIGSVPMILGTQMSHSVANLNANFVQGKGSAVLAGTGFTTASTTGTDIVGTLQTNGISMGIPAYITTSVAGAQATLSFWANLPFMYSTANWTSFTNVSDSNSFYVFPLSIGYNVSASYLRMPATVAIVSTTIATSAVNNVTGASTAFSETVAFNAVLYTVGTGANSRSLQYVFSTSAGVTWAVSVSQASTSNASRQSITQAITFPNEGASTNNLTTQYSVSSTNGPISTTQWSNFTGQRFLDIPFDTYISQGIYWLAVNRMRGTVGSKNIDFHPMLHGQIQPNLIFGNMGFTTNFSNAGWQLLIGSWTTTIAKTTSSIAFSDVLEIGSFPLPLVQLIRQV